MPCTMFEGWLEADKQCDCARLPQNLLDHCRSCPACEGALAAARAVQLEVGGWTASERSLERSWKRITDRLPNLGDRVDPSLAVPACERSGTPSPAVPACERSGPPPSQDSPTGRFLRFSWPLVLAGGLGIVFFFFSVLNPESRKPDRANEEPKRGQPTQVMIVGAISGSGGRFIGAGGEVPVSPIFRESHVGDELILSGGKSRANMEFKGGSFATLDGKCRLRITSEGFQVMSGTFRGHFRKGPGPLKIVVPGAFLAIRGTLIKFDLTEREGAIELVDGQVEIEPVSPPGPTFVWMQGSRLEIREGRLAGKPVLVTETATEKTSPVASGTPPTPDETPGESVVTDTTAGEPAGGQNHTAVPVSGGDTASPGGNLDDVLGN